MRPLLALLVLVGCGSRSLDPDGSGSNLMIGPEGRDASAPSSTGSSTPGQTGDACRSPELTERLASAIAALCDGPRPTRTWEGADGPERAAFKSMLPGRWVSCPSMKGPGIPGPDGQVGIEFTADGWVYFLTIDCTGAIVRGRGTFIPDADRITSWEGTFNWELNQLNVVYGKPPGLSYNILHGTFETSPKRMYIDVMGVFDSTYVPAPDRI